MHQPVILFLAHKIRTYLPSSTTDSGEEEPHPEFAATLELAASLAPVTHDEANLVALHVAASIQALDALRLARCRPDDSEHVLLCMTRAASMMRQAKSWRTTLERVQAQRRKLAAAAETDDAAIAPPPPEPQQHDATAAAELYARQHRKRAMLIRRLGRLPDKMNIGFVPPDVVHALATGTTPILRALDDKPPSRVAVAA